MTDLGVFGGCLRTALEFPELRPTNCAPTWLLHRIDAEPALGALDPIGEDVVDGEIKVRAFRSPAGFVLSYDDTGTFAVRDGGRDIVWWPHPGASEASARLDVLGRVLPLALHAAGILTLHGSAVAFGGGAIAFLAPKYHGKSTLAYALVRAGAKLITDDALAVEPGPPPIARPGVHCVRLFADSAARLGANGSVSDPTLGKLQLDALPDELRMRDAASLDAIYLLDPLAPSAEAPAAWREPLDSVVAAVALVRHAKLGPLLGGAEAATLFEQAVGIARAVPVYTLRAVRDLARLDETVERILGWHAAPARS